MVKFRVVPCNPAQNMLEMDSVPVGDILVTPPPLSKQRLCPSNTRCWFRQFLHR